MDAVEYLSIARNLSAHRFYSYDGGTPTMMRQPLYPAFLSILMSLFGQRLWVVYLTQGLVNLLTITLVFLLAERIADRPTALLAATACTAYWPFLGTAGNVLTECLYAALVTLSTLVWVNLIRTRSPQCATLAGVLWGLTTLCRPTTIGIPLFALLYGLWPYRGRERLLLSRVAVTVVPFCVVLGPWFLRNGLVLGRWTPVSTDGGINLWVGSSSQGDLGRAMQTAEFGTITRGEYYIETGPNDRFLRAALRNWRGKPIRLVSRGLVRMLSSWSYMPGTRPYRTANLWLWRVATGFHIAFMIFAAVGIAEVGLAKASEVLLLPCYVSLALIGSWCTARYMLPFIPLLSVFTSIGIRATTRRLIGYAHGTQI